MFDAILSFLQVAILTAAPVFYMVARSTSRTRPTISAICATVSFCSALGSLCVLAAWSFFVILGWGNGGDTLVLPFGLAVMVVALLIADIRLILVALRKTRTPPQP